MKFNLAESIKILERTPIVLEELLHNLSLNWTDPNEGPDTWSPSDIIGHYIHGEKTDWIPRMEIILSEIPDKTFTPFDRFAQLNDGQGKSLSQLLEEFKVLRAANIQILKSKKLTEEDLNKQGLHPELGTVTLSQLLASWVVHDLNHIVQISRVMAVQLSDEVGPWKAYLSILKS